MYICINRTILMGNMMNSQWREAQCSPDRARSPEGTAGDFRRWPQLNHGDSWWLMDVNAGFLES